MKNLLFLLSITFLFNCGGNSTKKSDSLIGMEFSNFKQVEKLSNFAKISDTVIYGNTPEPKHGILHLQNKTNRMVLFKNITYDVDGIRTFGILDTLIIPNLNKSELITIGYCQMDNDKENLIAVVDKTDSLRIQNIKKVWKANITSGKIELVNVLNEVSCFNELYVLK